MTRGTRLLSMSALAVMLLAGAWTAEAGQRERRGRREAQGESAGRATPRGDRGGAPSQPRDAAPPDSGRPREAAPAQAQPREDRGGRPREDGARPDAGARPSPDRAAPSAAPRTVPRRPGGGDYDRGRDGRYFDRGRDGRYFDRPLYYTWAFGYRFGSPYDGRVYGYYTPYDGRRRYYGEVRLDLRPRDAEVYVDGYFAGLVDDFDGRFERLTLEVGPHRIEIVAPGFVPRAFDVYVDPDRTIDVHGDLVFARP